MLLILLCAVEWNGHKTEFPTASTQFYCRWTRQCADGRSRVVSVERREFECCQEPVDGKNTSAVVRPQSKCSSIERRGLRRRRDCNAQRSRCPGHHQATPGLALFYRGYSQRHTHD